MLIFKASLIAMRCLENRRSLSLILFFSFEDVSCLAESASLSEVSLDGNPFSQDGAYKQTILRHMQQLRQLDMRKVTVSANSDETINRT